MLHHVSLGVDDVEKAAGFYDAVLGTLGYARVMEYLPYAIGYGEKTPIFWIGKPDNQKPASVGNGVHIAFAAASKAAVDAFHRVAMAKGGKDEGAAGPRPDYSPQYYGAFVRDPFGNKLEATFIAAAPKPTKARAKTRAKAKAKKKPAPLRNARKRPGRKSPAGTRRPARTKARKR